jgi:AcrR family transcriptional regulator
MNMAGRTTTAATKTRSADTDKAKARKVTPPKLSAVKPRAKSAATDKRREKGEASSQRIVDAAIDLIANEGLANVTMQRIAAQVGVSSALVVFHFRNMENLYQAVLEHLSELYDALWERNVNAPGLTNAQRLFGAMDCAQTFMQQYPQGVSVLIAFSGDRKSMRIYRKIALPSDHAYLAIGRKLVDLIAEEGGYRNVDLDVVSESLNYLIYGSWLWDHIDNKASRAPMLRKCAMLLLEQAFPKHFPLRRP